MTHRKYSCNAFCPRIYFFDFKFWEKLKDLFFITSWKDSQE